MREQEGGGCGMGVKKKKKKRGPERVAKRQANPRLHNFDGGGVSGVRRGGEG